MVGTTSPGRGLRRAAARVGAVALLAAGLGAAAPAGPAEALADAAPLPTVQINGVVWDQVIVGGTVYVTGSFSSARPPGAAAGSNETPRANLLAYDLASGALVTTWAPTLNAQGVTIAASADRRTIYVGGDFTVVNGLARSRIVALDAVTGATRTAFVAKTDARVRSLSVANGVVYAGGSFSSANNVARSRLAAFSETDGSLLSWAPSANMFVSTVRYAPRGAAAQVLVGGVFSTINGTTTVGMASLDPVTGALLSWPANQTIRNGGNTGLGITDLTTDGRQIYGTGFNFVGYAPGRLEGSFAADLNGNIQWINGCHGDSYSIYPGPDAEYHVGHEHDCSQIGDSSFVDTRPRTYRRAVAFSLDPGQNWVNTRTSDFPSWRSAAPLSWHPFINTGAFTGQDQGPWDVTGDGTYLLVGGEFTQVAGLKQQGLVRFRLTSGPPTQGQVVASDSFSRQVAAGWGVAEAGGAWSGATALTSVDGTTGGMTVTPGQAGTVTLPSVGPAGSDLTYTMRSDTALTAGSWGSYAVARRTSTGDYRLKVTVTAAGAVSLSVVSVVAGVSTTLGSASVPGLTATAGATVQVRVQVTGASPTTVQARAWAAGTAEPTTWQVSGTDGTAGLQGAGIVGITGYATATANQAVTVRFDNLVVRSL